jgi:hypothetical protein
MPFLFIETRKAARIIAGGKTPDEITRLSVEENFFQLEKEKRRREMASKMRLRLSALSDCQLSLLSSGSDEDAKLVAFYAMEMTDLLLFEFMRQVFQDKAAIGQLLIADSDIEIFMTAKANESEKVASWSANNLGRVKNTYKNVLCEAGLAKKQPGRIQIMKPVLSADARKCWKKHDIYAEAMLLEV